MDQNRKDQRAFAAPTVVHLGPSPSSSNLNVKGARSFSARQAFDLYNDALALGVDGRRPVLRHEDGSEISAEEKKRDDQHEFVKSSRSSSSWVSGSRNASAANSSSLHVPSSRAKPQSTSTSTSAASGLVASGSDSETQSLGPEPLPEGNSTHIRFDNFSRKEQDFGSHLKVARSVSQANRYFSMFKYQKDGRSSQTRRPITVNMDRCWEYWRKQMRSPTVFSLLTDFPRSMPPERKADEVVPWAPDMAVVAESRVMRVEVPAIWVNSIKALSLDTHSTLFEVFLAVFQGLLFRYSRETDVTVYSHTGVNVVPLRVNVTGELTFKKLLRLTKICVEQAYYYDLIDIEELAADLQVPNFTYIGYQLEYAKETSDPSQLHFIKSHELGLHVSLHSEGNAVISLHYNPKVFAAESADQLLSHYIEMAKNLTQFQNLNSTIAVVPIMSASETKEVTSTLWRDSVGGPLVDHSSQAGHEKEYAWSNDTYLHALFENQMAKAPKNPCIDDEGKIYSFADVNDRANRIAHYLISTVGVKVGELVATLLPRGADVYICQLAIMKAGCGYVCIDSSYPQDRVDYILQDSKSRCMITVSPLAGRQKVTGELLLDKSETTSVLAKQQNTNPPSREMGLKSSDVCYVIYTSGTTGVPKGVVIEHRCAVNFVIGESHVFKVTSKDRVLQGFSPSFDASVEEIWLAFYSGGTLVVGTLETMQSGPNLPQLLYKLGITVVSTVPTLLTMFTPSTQKGDVNDLPNIHLLILGGEACPAELVNRWAPNRRLINSYGPTEATVVSTFEQSYPGKRVTIGKPLPNYYCCVLDANMQPCPVGVPGELHIGGVALARGYLNLPDKTDEKFIPNPFKHLVDTVPRLYKTGDLCRYLRNGDIEFLGRIDSQVKLRGFRVELSEIESVICQLETVRSAVVAVKGQNLLAFIVPKDPNSSEDEQKHGSVFVEDPNSLLLDPEHDEIARNFDVNSTRDYMKKMLPHYMMPGQLILVKDIPSLPSGKADRKTLLGIQVKPSAAPAGKKKGGRTAEEKRAAAAAAAAAAVVDSDDEDEEKLTVMEKQVQSVWEDVLGQSPISIHEDFFTDLGGHSVVAALVISALRKKDYVVSMRELYENATISKFCKKLEEQAEKSKEVEAPQQAPPLPEYKGPLVSDAKDYAVWIYQTFIILCGFAWLGYIRVGLYYLARFVVERDWFEWNLTSALWMGFALPAVFTTLTIASYVGLCLFKWILIGKVEPGRYPIWGWFHLRWWTANKIAGTFPMTFFRDTVVQRIFYWMLGASIGNNVYLGSFLIYDFDLVTIEDGASIGTQARISPHRFEGGYLILERIHIGKNCYVGPRAAVNGGAIMRDNSRLEALSLLPPGFDLPAGMVARGSPAVIVGPASEDDDEEEGHNGVEVSSASLNDGQTLLPTSRVARKNKEDRGCGLLVALGQAFFFPIHGFFTIYPYFPAAVITYLYFGPPGWTFNSIMALALPLVFASVILFVFIIVALRWAVCWTFSPGKYSLNSWTYFRKWFLDILTDTALMNLQTMYATVYTPLFLRMMGMKLGKSVEASTLFDYIPELTVLEDECFIADHVAMGSCRVDRGFITMKETRVGKRTFVGNNAVLVAGSKLASNSLIGVNSVPPEGPMADNTSWVGSPSFLLPSRKIAQVDEDSTYNPSSCKYFHRAVWEFFKIMFPPYLASANYGAFLFAIAWTVANTEQEVFIAVSPLWGVVSSAATLFVVFLLKWYLIGKFRQRNYALWSVEVWRAEFVQALEENIVAPAFLVYAMGSWWAVAWFRLLGANIGERVMLDSIYLCESDLISIDDDSTVESGATIQTHLFEDRVMKMEPLHIGKGCSVGANSVVLYSSRMEDGSALDQCSLAMKGETLMPRLRYEGIPAVAAVVHNSKDLSKYKPPTAVVVSSR